MHDGCGIQARCKYSVGRVQTLGEKRAGELGCRSVLGFSQVDSAQSKCGAVDLDLSRANCSPGEIGAEECDYIMSAPLAG